MKHHYSVLLLLACMLLALQPATSETSDHLLSFSDMPEQKSHIEKGTDLAEALSILEDRYNVHFLYRSQLLNQKELASTELPTPGRELSDVLQGVLRDSDLTYRQIENRTIGITSIALPEAEADFQQKVSGQVRT